MQVNNLKTQCKNCFFLRQDDKCNMGFETETNGTVHTKGVCFSKRTPEWVGKAGLASKPLDQIKDYVNKDSFTLGCVLNAKGWFDNDLINAITVLLLHNIKDLYILSDKKSFNKDVWDQINGMCENIRIQLEVFSDDFPDEDSILDGTCNKMKANWFCYMDQDSDCNFPKEFYYVSESIGHRKFGAVKCNNVLVFNRHLYIQCRGNVGKLFIDKLKEFDNKDMICVSV